MRVTLDRIPQFDDRSRAYRVERQGPLKSKVWRDPAHLDQGELGGCVGFGWTGAMAASPWKVRGLTDETARLLYSTATRLDDIPGSWPPEDTGSSVLAGAKAVQRAYRFDYRWAFDLHDVLDALANTGPVVLGVNWYTGMFEPDSGRLARIHVSGRVEGGHCLLARGVGFKSGHVRLRNSWGLFWGQRGDAMISFEDLDRLLHEDGEACIPTHNS